MRTSALLMTRGTKVLDKTRAACFRASARDTVRPSSTLWRIHLGHLRLESSRWGAPECGLPLRPGTLFQRSLIRKTNIERRIVSPNLSGPSSLPRSIPKKERPRWCALSGPACYESANGICEGCGIGTNARLGDSSQGFSVLLNFNVSDNILFLTIRYI